MNSSQPSVRHKISFVGLTTWFKLYLPVAMVAMMSVQAKYLLNAYQISIQELWLPLLLQLITATIVTTVFYRLWRRNRLATYVGALLATAALTNAYDARFLAIEPFLKAFTPLPEQADPTYSLAFILIILLASYWAGRGISRLVTNRRWNTHNIIVALTIAITSTFILQTIPAARNLVVAWPQFFYHPPALAAPKPASSTAKPDIYYIVLDRYASPEVLKTQFGYDNADFLQYLNDNKFYVNTNSHQNYPYTAQSIASTMSANYNRDMIQKFGQSGSQTIIPYDQTIRNSPVAAYLKSIGYKYTLIGNWYETSNLSPIADQAFQNQGLLTIFNRTFTIDNFGKNDLLESPYWRFLQPGLTLGKYQLYGYHNAGGDQMTLSQLQALKKVATLPAGGKFVFAHLLIPHDPYFFNADGSLNPYRDGDNNGAPIKQKYLGQVKFINSQIKQAIDIIKRNTNNQATIVLQSDEGPYPVDLNQEDFDQDLIQGELANGSMLRWSDKDLKMKFGNLAAYYIPGASQDALITGGTAVNSFRLVLNTLFNTKLPYLPECYYAYPNGRAKPFWYKSVDDRLTGQSNTDCANDGTGPKA